jgi:hypothetical protein
LEQFAEIDICLPVNVLIQPNATADAFNAIVEAEQAVVDALSFRVADNVLFVESAANFSTGRPIKVTSEHSCPVRMLFEPNSGAREAPGVLSLAGSCPAERMGSWVPTQLLDPPPPPSSCDASGRPADHQPPGHR